MSYTIYSKNNPNGFSIDEGTLNDADTSLTLVGKDYFGYGEIIAQNSVDLLQNFASDDAPTNPVEGQIWFDTSTSLIKVLSGGDGANGTWLAFDPSSGPTDVIDTQNATHSVYIIRQGGTPVAAFSAEPAYALHATNEPLLASFPNGINEGITLSSASAMFHGTATSAQYADLAEMYASDADYEPGTVLKIGGEAEVTQTTDAFCPEVFGIVSTNPAYLMNSALEGTAVAVALEGRVPCKVIGEVKKGQRLVASEEPGVARAATGYEKQESMDWNRIVGRALEDKTTLGIDTVEVVVGVK